MTAEQYLPCSFCGNATHHATLRTFGSRCKPCFDAYCLESPEPPANPKGRQSAFLPRRVTAEARAEVALPPAVPMPTAPAANTDEPPAWTTEA